jgi:hypothetical protein
MSSTMAQMNEHRKFELLTLTVTGDKLQLQIFSDSSVTAAASTSITPSVSFKNSIVLVSGVTLFGKACAETDSRRGRVICDVRKATNP